jgi:hypothetical protein
MKRLLLAVVLLLVLGLGGVGAMTLLGKGPFAGMLKMHPPEAKKEEGPKPPEDRAMDVGNYMIPLIEDHQIAREIAIDVAVQVDPKSGYKVGSQLAKLQNAFLATLMDTVPRHSNPKSDEDKQAIAEHLRKSGNNLFGPDTIKLVVIKDMYIR